MDNKKLSVQLMAIEGIDGEKGLRNMRGNVAKYLIMLRQFDATHGKDMAKLSEYLADGEVDKALKIVHTLRGIVGMLGLTRLQEVINVLHESLRINDGGKGDYVNLVDTISTEQVKLYEALAQIQ